jgi:DNA-binding MarR family transcriptional regulator
MSGEWQQSASYASKPGSLVVADGTAAQVAGDLVELSGARVIKRLDWRAVTDGVLGNYGVADLVQIDAVGISDTMLDSALPILDSFARDKAARIVAGIEERQIDLVAGHLFGRHVQLLVAPSQAEHIAALAIAGSMRPDLLANEAARDVEAIRLRRLNEEVARIAETLARLTRDDSLSPVRPALGVTDRKIGYGAPPSAEDAAVSPQEIRQAIRSRRLRSQFFDEGLFEDPAWDMLLDLFAADLERAQVSVSSLCIAAAVAPTTALRWISKMTEAGLFLRQPDPFDRRRAFMALSDKAQEGMRQYCTAVRRAGLSIA